MLANLLPGFRDLRTPLVSGYAWLLFLWLVIQPDIPKSRPSDGIVAALWDIVSLAGRPGSIAAASVVAFVIGAITQVQVGLLSAASLRIVPRSTVERLGATHRKNIDQWVQGNLSRFGSDANWTRPLHDASDLPLVVRSHVDRQHQGALDQREDGNDDSLDGSYVAAIADSIEEERGTLTTRLQLDRQPVYNDYDRLLAEASFRASLVAPLAGVVIVSAFDQSYWLFGLLVLPAALAWQAAIRQLQGDSKLWGALVGDYIESPTMEQVVKILVAAREPVDPSDAVADELLRKRQLMADWRQMLIDAVDDSHDDSERAVKLPKRTGYASLAPYLDDSLRAALEQPQYPRHTEPDGGLAYTDYSNLWNVGLRIEELERAWFPDPAGVGTRAP